MAFSCNAIYEHYWPMKEVDLAEGSSDKPASAEEKEDPGEGVGYMPAGKRRRLETWAEGKVKQDDRLDLTSRPNSKVWCCVAVYRLTDEEGGQQSIRKWMTAKRRKD